MRKNHVLLRGAAIMTAFSLCGKLLGVLLRLFLSARIGSEGIGLYQLIMSVYGLFSAVSTAGLTVSVSRLCAEKGERSRSDARLTLQSASLFGLVISLSAAALLFLAAKPLAVYALRDARTAIPFRILALSMPFMALSACLKGHFLAERRVLCTSSASFFEQCVKFAVMALCLNVFFAQTNDIETLCIGIVCGVTVGESASFLYLCFAYRVLPGRIRKADFHPTETFKDNLRTLLSVVSPIGLSVTVTSFLHTAENLLIPGAFARFGGDRAKALSDFGVIRGMVLPLLFFPFAFLQSLVSVLIPEISRLQAAHETEARDRQIRRILRLAFLFGIAAGGLFFFLTEELSETFYPHQETAFPLRVLALINPFMYVQTICDGLLKALGGQNYTLRYSIYNSVLRLAVILTVIPLTGSMGYLLLLILSNTLEFSLCYRRLKRYAHVSVPFVGSILLPLVSAAAAGLSARLLLTLPFFPTPLSGAIGGSAVYAGVFLLLCGTRAVKETRT